MFNNLDEDFVEVAKNLDLYQLVDFASAMETEAKTMFQKSKYLNFLVVQKMEAEEATKITTTNSSAELDYKVEWDFELLETQLLKDEVLKDRLIETGAYIPAHTITTDVPSKFNMTKTKPIAKEGKEKRNFRYKYDGNILEGIVQYLSIIKHIQKSDGK